LRRSGRETSRGEPPSSSALFADVELQLVDPPRNRFRFYAVTETATLFEAHALAIAWGRIGGPMRRRLETFDSREALERRRRTLLATRERHGYAARVASPHV
jgi:predicted DNA-binding WGR domain protein